MNKKNKCLFCESENLTLCLMRGLFCLDCKKSQYPNTKEEQKQINKMFKGVKK